MKKILLGTAVFLLAVGMSVAAPANRWLHVTVVDGKGKNAEKVRVNVPLALAEAVLPAIQVDQLHSGKLQLDECEIDGVDFLTILEAVRDTEDGEFVSVEGADENIRVVKEKGYLKVTVAEGKNSHGKSENVNVQIPFAVVEALFSGEKNELDLLGAVKALSAHGDTLLVTVDDGDSKVRVWIDSENISTDESE